MAVAARRNPGAAAALHRRRIGTGEGPLRPVRRDHRKAAVRSEVSASQLDLTLVWPALIAGLVVSATHVPLGIQVLKRGIVFIDLAVAQIAALGVVFAYWLGYDPHGWEVQTWALAAAVTGALLLNVTDTRWPDVQEAVIGVSFVLASNAAILLLA